MRVLLLSPTQRNVYGRLSPPYPPLGLLQIGACLKVKGHDVQFLDAGLYPGEVEPAFRYFNPDMVCITSVTPTYPAALGLARLARQIRRTVVVMGGPHVSVLPEEAIETGLCDHVVLGEGEETVVELAASLEGGDPSTVKGICTLLNGRAVKTGERDPIRNLDLLPFPDWSLVRRNAAYTPPEPVTGRVFTVMTSRGCPFGCSFCVSSRLFGRKMRRRSVRNVMEEIGLLVRERRAREIHLADDCFTADRTWVLEFARELRTAGLGVSLSFMNGLRADQVDAELLEALRGAGVRTLGFGVETGDELLMNRSGKNLSMERVESAFEMSRKAGFKTWGFFIIGFPGETEEQAESTLELSLRLDPDFAKYFPLVPFPGSRLFDEMRAEGMLERPEWAEFNLYSKNVPTLSLMGSERTAQLISRFYRRFYLRPGKSLSRLARIRAPSELWLHIKMLAFLVDRFTSA